MSKVMKTGINAKYIVAFDGAGHRILKDGVVVIENDEIVFVGKKYEGALDQQIDAADRVVSPGFVNTHSHVDTAPMIKSFIEDIGNPQFYMSELFEDLIPALKDSNLDSVAASTAISMVELIGSGTTTAVVMGADEFELVSEILHGAGLRAYVIPPIRSGTWYTEDGKVPVFRKFEREGFDLLEKAVAFFETCKHHYNGKIKTMLGPTWTANVVPELLKEIRSTAQKTGMRVKIHAAEAVNEFQEILRRHGKTPIQYLESVGLLGDDLIIGHCIYTSGNSWTAYPGDEDVQLLAERKVSVAHCPWVFAKRGFIMESFAKYRNAGVNMSIGTDTYPQNNLLEMRYAALMSKIYERDSRATTAAHVFDAATLGGAKALGRDDLGRISPGAKADLVFFRLDTPRMSPIRDPIRNIVYCADPTDIADVMIAGQMVMKNRHIEGIDVAQLSRELQKHAEKMWRTIPERDWAGRSANELSPLSYPLWEEGRKA